MVQKEKQVKAYTRKSKSGKQVQVKSYSAKYESAEDMVKEALKQKKGAGKELEDLKKKKPEKVKDLINDPKSPWFEFENNFEEGWGGDSSVFCLANNTHHREVANLAANELAKKYNGESFFQKKGWESIAQKAYNDAAKKLYPKEKLWSGDNEDNPAFWHEHLTAGGSKKNAIKQLWRKEWGSFENFGKKSTVKATKKAPYEKYGFTKDEFKEWYEGTGSKADEKVEKALKKAMGTKAYTAFSDKAADEYKKGGAHRFFTKGLEEMKASTSADKKSVTPSKETKTPKGSKGIGDLNHPTEWSRSMQKKYSGSTGRDAEVASLLGVFHSLRLAPTGYTKGAIQTAIRELKKAGDTKKVKSLEKLLAQKEKAKSKTSRRESKAPLSSAQRHAINALLDKPGWTMSKAEKYVRTLSPKEVDKLRR